MEGLDYNVALAVFFPFYVAAEIPSNMMLKKLRPSVWFTAIMIAWAACTTLMGVVENYSGLLAARMFLGIAEGGLFPGVTFYITMWYRRHECGLRMALFFSAATAAGAFGGLLARGITEMAGVGGRPGWSWIFIIEGLLTLLVACVAYWVINDYPKTQVLLYCWRIAYVKTNMAIEPSFSHKPNGSKSNADSKKIAPRSLTNSISNTSSKHLKTGRFMCTCSSQSESTPLSTPSRSSSLPSSGTWATPTNVPN